MPFTVAATLRIKKKHVPEFTKLVKRHAQNTMTKEPGCITFEVSIDRDDPRRFLFYEVYVTEADFDHHMATPWMTRQMAKTAHMVDGDVDMVGFFNRLAAPNK